MKPLADVAIAHLHEIVAAPTGDVRYEIKEQIGEGGMGAVYLARDRELGRDVALKVLRAPVPTEEERERLVREAQILAALEHPGIVPVHDVGTLSDGRLFYVMKHVRGERFDDYARGNRSRAELLRAFLLVCEAVSFAHAAGVIHRDLKPQNVMLGPFGEVLVLDWGVAKVRSRTGTSITDRQLVRQDSGDRASATAAGTPGYMAPEQVHGAADERVDVYGLGGILHFIILRAHPAPATGAESYYSSDAPAALQAICDRARAGDPDSRYQSVAELAGDIANYLDALPVAAHREGMVERVRRVAVRHRTAILLVLAYLVVRVTMLIFAGG
jgi:eukaryotic-like serine/threonine-protein kinase